MKIAQSGTTIVVMHAIVHELHDFSIAMGRWRGEAAGDPGPSVKERAMPGSTAIWLDPEILDIIQSLPRGIDGRLLPL